jgi:endoglucanase
MNPLVVERLISIAKQREVPHQLTASGKAQPNDSNAIQINRAGVATGLVAIPNRYMHSAVEMISLDDIDRTADLLAEFVAGLASDEDFTP